MHETPIKCWFFEFQGNCGKAREPLSLALRRQRSQVRILSGAPKYYDVPAGSQPLPTARGTKKSLAHEKEQPQKLTLLVYYRSDIESGDQH